MPFEPSTETGLDFWNRFAEASKPKGQIVTPVAPQPALPQQGESPVSEKVSAEAPDFWDRFAAASSPSISPTPGTAAIVPEEKDASAARIEQLARKKAADAVEVERSLPGEVGASLVRGALGLAKLPIQVAKIVGSDVLGSETVKKATVPIIESLEETAESPEWKPSKWAGGKPIDLDRLISNPGEVIGQITANITNPRFWASQLPEGAMSMIPAFVGAVAPRMVAYAGKLGTALKAAEAAGRTAEVTEIGRKLNRLSTIGMYGMSMAMEAAQAEEKVRAYELRHPDKPIPWGNRVLSILGTGAVAGGLEALSFGRVFLGKYGGELSLQAMVKQVLNGKGGNLLARKVIDSVATEGVTEGAQTFVENLFAKHGYDVDQKLTEGIVESILVGAALGGVGGAFTGLNVRGKAVKEAAARIQETKRLAEEEYQGTLQASQEGAARGEVYAEMPGPQEMAPPEPVLAPIEERAAPQPTAPTPEEQHQAIFGNRFAENLPRADAIRALVPEMGSYERAERFYDLYQQGDAATALKEFPELSAWATPAQREAARILPVQPLGTTGAEVAERATLTPTKAGEREAGTETGLSAEAPTALPMAPMGVAGAAAEDLVAAQHRGEVAGQEVVEGALGPIREQQALREQALEQAGGAVPEVRLRRMAAQEVEDRLSRGEEVEPEVIAKFPELAAKYGIEVPISPAMATSPETITAEPPVAPASPVAPTRGKPAYDLTKAEERYDRATIIKAYGKFNSRADILQNFTPEERKQLFPYVKQGAQGPDELLQELKGSSYGYMFNEFETDADLLRGIIDGKLKPRIQESLEDYYDEEIARQAAAEGFDTEGALAEAESLVENEVISEEDALEALGGEGLTLDTFWEDLEGTEGPEPPLTPSGPPKYSLKQAAFGLKSPTKPPAKFEKRLQEVLGSYPDLDPEKVSLVLRAQPQAANADIAFLSRLSPEEIDQVSRGNLAATEREQLFRKATDLGQQKGLPGLGQGGLFDRVAEAPAVTVPLTTKTIQEAFGPEARVTASILMPDVHEVELPNGTRILVKQNAEIQVTPEALAHYGKKEIGPGEYLAGEWRSLNGINLISLAKGEGAQTLNHEVLHAAMELVLTKRERAAILKQYGNEEAAARAYETWNPQENPHSLFQKILDFFRRLVEIFRPTAEGTFGKIKSGEVWSRKAKGQAEGEQRLSIRAAEAETRLQAYQDKMMAPEGKEPSGWQQFKDRVFLRGDTKQEAADTLKGWYDEIVDRYAPFERAQARAVKSGGLIPAGETPTYTLAFWRGQEGWTAQAVMKNGVYQETKEGDRFTGDNRKVGESLNKRLDPIRDLAEARGEKPETVMNDLFNRFMVAQRDLELAGETGAREAGEIKGVNPEESRAVLEDLKQIYGADYDTLERVAGKLEASGDFTPGSIREWADQAILQRLEQAGLITPELRREIKAKNQFYLPFRRLMDQVNEYVNSYARALGVKGKVIETIKGSEKQILDPLQMLMDLAAKANYAYARNRIFDSVARLGEFDPEIYEVKGKIIPGIEKSGETPFFGLPTKEKTYAWSQLPPEPGTVPYYRDGKLRWLKLPADMFKATQNMMPEDIGLLLSWAKKPADLLRAGAVTTPEFGLITNPFRDIAQAWVFSRFGFSPLKWFRDLGLLLSKNQDTLELRNKAEAGGGFMATLAQSFLDTEKITADDITGKKKGMWYAAHPVQAMRHASAYLENLTRFSIYKQAREKGLSHAEAIHEMRRTTLDFRRTGGHPVVRYLNMIIPFFNASIQGTDKLLSELAGPNKHQIMRRLAMMAAGSIGLWFLAHQDDRYKELENWERNYFWHIPLGKNGPMIRLPKPFEAGIMFGSVPERILDQLVDKNVGGVKSAIKSAYDALTPEFIPAFARGIIEGRSNYNWFLDRPIEDMALQQLPVELRSKPWTTELAKAVSKYVGPVAKPVMELSPVKVEHLIRTMSGGLGANFFLPGIDVALRKAGILEDIPQPEQDWIQKAWGVRALFTKPPVGYRAKSVGDFFETYQKTVQADQGWKNLWNTGNLDKLEGFLKDNPEAMFARVARKQMAELGKIKKERNVIHLSRTLSSEQKKTKLDILDEKIVQLVKAGNTLMDPEVAKAVGMPSRFKKDEFGQRKSMDLDGYYKFVVESVGDAYEGIQKEIPRLLRMDDASRQRFLIKTIRQAREDYQPLLKKPEDVLRPYRFQNLLDKPTRKERAAWQQMFGARKIPPGAASGYRLKEEKEARP